MCQLRRVAGQSVWHSPTDAVTSISNDFQRPHPVGWYAITDQSEKENFVQALADLFTVSRLSVAIRIGTLNLAA
ncbi:hypothetical protein CIP107582_01045 [Corynebacterium diphtheriae]|nr:hypothetical protein CIP107582_01045 [Corynebacterium diphtheriae]